MRDTLFIALFPVSRRNRARLRQGADNIGVLSGIVNGMETGKQSVTRLFLLAGNIHNRGGSTGHRPRLSWGLLQRGG
jgi:hypothetical protein